MTLDPIIGPLFAEGIVRLVFDEGESQRSR